MLTSLRTKKQNSGRTEQSEALEQLRVLSGICRHVRLQQQHFLHALTHARIGEGEALHLFARHAPVGVEVEHDGLASGGHSLLQLCHRADLLKADCTWPFSSRPPGTAEP